MLEPVISYLHWVAQEVIVGRVFVHLRVVEHIVALNSPLASDPLMKTLVKGADAGQLIVLIDLRRDFELSRLRVTLVVDVFVVRVVRGTPAEASCFHSCQRSWVLKKGGGQGEGRWSYLR